MFALFLQGEAKALILDATVSGILLLLYYASRRING